MGLITNKDLLIQQLETATEMRNQTWEILKRIYNYEKTGRLVTCGFPAISFSDFKNHLIDFLCILSDQQTDLRIELETKHNVKQEEL